jgi:hypothetical protein
MAAVHTSSDEVTDENSSVARLTRTRGAVPYEK